MTDKEKQLAKEMIDLADKIKTETSYLNTRQRIPQLQLEIIIAKIRALHEKAVVLGYLHKHADDLITDHQKLQDILAPSIPIEPKTPNIQVDETPILKKEEENEIEIETKEIEIKTETIEPEILSKVNQEFSINDRLSNQTDSGSISSKLQNKPISDIKSAIGLNEKIMYQKELFNGNSEKYSLTISTLNSHSSLFETEEYFKNLSKEMNWDSENSIVKSFWGIVSKRY